MTRQEFVALCHRLLDSYLLCVESMVNDGTLRPKYPIDVYYPQVLIIAESKDHFIFELMGLGPRQSLSLHFVETPSTESYFHQFNLEPSQRGATTLDGTTFVNIVYG